MEIESSFRPSIIITSFNHKNYLAEAVESVLAQTMTPHEVIIADDCSTDGSQSLIADYQKRFPDLIRSIIQDRNVGIPRNRNCALNLVTGSHVGILDGDDYFVSDKLEKQFRALEGAPDAGAVYGNFQLVDPERKPLQLKWRQSMPSGDIFVAVAGFMTGILRTLVVRHDLVKRAGLMDPELPMYDGLWLTIQLAVDCRFVYVDEVLVHKRDHASSDSKVSQGARNVADLRLIQKRLQPLMKDRVSDAEAGEINRRWDAVIGRFASKEGGS
jgi:glycosyltransferase involved in cell wall biosynthesis